MNFSAWLTERGLLLAETASETTKGPVDIEHLLRALLAVFVFSIVGVAVLALSIWVMTKVVPFSMRKEIEEDQNTALGIIVGAIIIGISIIIAAAVMG